MWIQLVCFAALLGSSQVHSFIQVPKVYRKMDVLLQRYAADPNSNPIVHSLLNVLVYDKRARAFISERAIQTSLNEIGKWNRKDEQTLRKFLDKTRVSPPQLSSQVKDQLTEVLDKFFAQPNLDDYDTFKNIIDKHQFDWPFLSFFSDNLKICFCLVICLRFRLKIKKRKRIKSHRICFVLNSREHPFCINEEFFLLFFPSQMQQ